MRLTLLDKRIAVLTGNSCGSVSWLVSKRIRAGSRSAEERRGAERRVACSRMEDTGTRVHGAECRLNERHDRRLVRWTRLVERTNDVARKTRRRKSPLESPGHDHSRNLRHRETLHLPGGANLSP